MSPLKSKPDTGPIELLTERHRGLASGEAWPPSRWYIHAVSGNFLLSSVIIGSVGMGLFMYGKRQRRAPHLVVGIVLMAYTYFVPSVPLMIAIAIALVGLLYLARYLGL